jgi:F-type H+-transporting ATPase subunit delta
MRDIKVASRYAKSLLGIAIEQNSLEEIYNDMISINKVCSENHDLVVMLKSPIVKTHKQEAILNAIFTSINKVSSAFIKIIIAKKRAGILADIAKEFIEAYKVHKNIKTAHVTSAIAITADQKAKIISLLNKTDNSTIDLQEIVNPDIIGGMILRVGDRQIDESIRRKLNNLELEFDDNPYIKEF